jgi:hypothetical protein
MQLCATIMCKEIFSSQVHLIYQKKIHIQEYVFFPLPLSSCEIRAWNHQEKIEEIEQSVYLAALREGVPSQKK